jgi:hypothetical protein
MEDICIFYGHLVYFVSIWYILWSFGMYMYFMYIWYSLWSFGTWFLVLVCCTKKNLATLPTTVSPSKEWMHSVNSQLLIKWYTYVKQTANQNKSRHLLGGWAKLVKCVFFYGDQWDRSSYFKLQAKLSEFRNLCHHYSILSIGHICT